MKISAVTTTYNEENNIPDLIKSLKDCDEIVIADDKSTDDTVKIAKKTGRLKNSAFLISKQGVKAYG